MTDASETLASEVLAAETIGPELLGLGSLETSDFLGLLYMLTGSGRTGILYVQQDLDYQVGEFRAGEFRAWLESGRIRHMEFGTESGVAALAELTADSLGRYQFEEGPVHPAPQLDVDVDTVAMDILAGALLPGVVFPGRARAVSPERLARLPLTQQQQQTLQKVEAGVPLADLVSDPESAHLLARLIWLGLLVPRKSRVARLIVGATRQVKGRVIIDEIILRRWQDDLGQPVKQVALRDEQNAVYTLLVVPGPLAGTSVLLPPELLIATKLKVGDTVLVQPFIG